MNLRDLNLNNVHREAAVASYCPFLFCTPKAMKFSVGTLDLQESTWVR